MGPEKTITVQTAFGGVVNIELSLDGTTWAQVASFTQPGKKIINMPGFQMRVNRAGAVSGTPNVDIGANDNGAQFVTLVAPAGDGAGAAVDVSALGELNAVTVLGTFSGNVSIQVSEDNTDWATCMSFTPGSPGIQVKKFTAQFMRVLRSGFTTAGTPTVQVGAANDPTSGASAGSMFNYFGDGSDGDVVLAAPLTLTRDMYYNTLDTATFAVDLAGFRLFVRNTLTMGAGSIMQNNGDDGVAGAAGAGGAGGTLTAGGAGGAGGVDVVGVAAADATAGAHRAAVDGGEGGTGEAGAGGDGGTSTALTATQTRPDTLPEAVLMRAFGPTPVAMTPGVGGGGGSGDTGTGTGGGGGGGGGMVMIAARIIVMNATAAIQANGGDGANAVSGNSGGGGGGSGGAVSVIFSSFPALAQAVASGGAGGTLLGTGTNGVAGGDGTVWSYDVSPGAVASL
jgi:hypothetical protein